MRLRRLLKWQQNLGISQTLVTKQRQCLRRLSPILKDVLLWVICYQIASHATEQSFTEGRVNWYGKINYRFEKIATATPTSSNHHPGQQAVLTVEASPSTSKEITTRWRLRWGLAFLRNKAVFSLGIYIVLLRHNAVALNRLQYSVNRTFICIRKPKNSWLTLLWYLLHCNGLEPNLLSLWGMPVRHFFLLSGSILHYMDISHFIYRSYH